MLAVLDGRSSRSANPAAPATRPPKEGDILQNLGADRAPSGLGAIRILLHNRIRNSEASAKRTSRLGEQDDDGCCQPTGLSGSGSFTARTRKPSRFCTDLRKLPHTWRAAIKSRKAVLRCFGWTIYLVFSPSLRRSWSEERCGPVLLFRASTVSSSV
jgi:hypothetical protein